MLADFDPWWNHIILKGTTTKFTNDSVVNRLVRTFWWSTTRSWMNMTACLLAGTPCYNVTLVIGLLIWCQLTLSCFDTILMFLFHDWNTHSLSNLNCSLTTCNQGRIFWASGQPQRLPQIQIVYKRPSPSKFKIELMVLLLYPFPCNKCDLKFHSYLRFETNYYTRRNVYLPLGK